MESKGTQGKWVAEILEATINEVSTSNFEISEFQLGRVPYEILKKDIGEALYGVDIDIESTNTFASIPVRLHQDDGAIMFCLKLKNFS